MEYFPGYFPRLFWDIRDLSPEYFGNIFPGYSGIFPRTFSNVFPPFPGIFSPIFPGFPGLFSRNFPPSRQTGESSLVAPEFPLSLPDFLVLLEASGILVEAQGLLHRERHGQELPLPVHLVGIFDLLELEAQRLLPVLILERKKTGKIPNFPFLEKIPPRARRKSRNSNVSRDGFAHGKGGIPQFSLHRSNMMN